jgi:tetratricopeptide (TPR) repeat protein
MTLSWIRHVQVFAVVALVAMVTIVIPRTSDAAEPAKEDKAFAAKRFREAMRLFKLKEFRRAAEIFEEAYSIAPHPDALLNAMDAYEQSGELALAAEASSRLLSDFSEGSARGVAERRLARLAPKLGRLRIEVAPGASDLRVDGAPARVGDRWVDPGSHLVEAKYEGATVDTRVEVAAGAVAQVKLEPA